MSTSTIAEGADSKKDPRLSKDDIGVLSRMFGPPDLRFIPGDKIGARAYERLLAHGLVEADMVKKPMGAGRGDALAYRRTRAGEAFLQALGEAV